MRAQPGRTKKLIVAFHFLRSEQAGWTCEQCRRQGLEKKRRCGFIPVESIETGVARPVWVRGKVATTECPKSFVTPESIEIVERFFARRQFGGPTAGELSAREADAFLALEQELQTERANGQ